MPLGEIVGAVGSLLGGLFGQSSADKQAEANRKMQLDAAQHGVEWRVKDAQAAGIHPLAALGMSPISLSPVSVGDPAGTFSQIGQDVGRAAGAAMTKPQAAQTVALEIARTQLDGLKIDNDIKRAELASRVRRAFGPVSTGSPVVPLPGANTARGADVGGQTLPLPGGASFVTSPTATSEEIERQYGDVVQNVYGTGRILYDAGRNLYDAARDDNGSIARADRGVRDFLSELFGINPAY